jgi:H+-translocating NAD(P) transhydrogenase subunit alpha
VQSKRGAGEAAGFEDAAYEAAGATVAADRRALLSDADLVLTVRQLPDARPRDAAEGRRADRHAASAHVARARGGAGGRGVRALAMELVPRITRAQKMDVAVVTGDGGRLQGRAAGGGGHGKFFPMLMTAAGTVPPAKVLVLGGCGGLQAIATARRLGAVVQGFDIRPAVKEQVESLGAQWVGMELAEAEGSGGYAAEVSEETQRREHEHLAKLVADADVVITTAQIPGRPAPVLITRTWWMA